MSTVTSTPGAATLDYTALRPAGHDADKPLFGGLSASAWLKILIVSGLLVALFRFNLARLWLKTNPISGEPNWGHTPIIPVIGLYYLFLNRDRLLAATVKPILFERLTRRRVIVSAVAIFGGVLAYFAGGTILGAVLGNSDTIGNIAGVFGQAMIVWGVLMLVLGWGLGNLVFGLLAFAFGIYPGQNDWLSDYGMVHTIFGVVLTLCGWEVMRVVWFPIAFLVCGIPWSGVFYSWLASPLQRLAAIVAIESLQMTGVHAERVGTKMFFTSSSGLRSLNVEEACAGLRSLMTFISIGAAVAFLSSRALWQKILITLAAVPIAIFCNVMRVTGQAYIDRLAGREWSEGFAHTFVGLVMLIPAFFLLLGVAWIIDRLVVEEVDDKAQLKNAAAAKKVAAASADKIVVAPKAVAQRGVKTQSAAPATSAGASAPAVAAAPAAAPAPAKPAAPAPAKLPPRRNLTGKPDRTA